MQPFSLRWLILFTLVVLLLPSCGDSADDGADTTLAPITTTAAQTTTTTTAPSTTTEVHTPTTVIDTAAEAAEAFNSSMAIIVELSMLLSDEFEALKTSMEEHRTDLSGGETIDTCCGAHIETIKIYDKSMAEEIGSAIRQVPNLTPWLEDFSDSLPGGQVELRENIEVLDTAWTDLNQIWRGVARGGDTFDVDTAIDRLDEAKAIAGTITEFGETCCAIALET
jgi:hypothetical protein